MKPKHLSKIILGLIILLAVLLRTYNLGWGSPYFFHPDERNIASAITRLEFPSQMNPKFFAYGSFPIYLTYFLGVLGNLFVQKVNIWKIDFGAAIMWGRVVSVILSVLTVGLVYFVIKRVVEGKEETESKACGAASAVAAAALAALTPGLIQFAHFGTFESILTFEYLLLFYLCLRLVRQSSLKDYLLVGLVLGLSMATKITNLILGPVILVSHLFSIKESGEGKNGKKRVYRKWLFFGILLLVAVIIGLGLSPYTILDYGSFRSAIKYESDVALGNLPVFYTGGFLKKTPFVYQLLHVFPWLLGPGLWIGGFLGVGFLVIGEVKGFWENKKVDKKILLLILFIASYLTFNSMMYVKWLRYMVPVAPFLIVALVVAFNRGVREVRGIRVIRGIMIVVTATTVVSGVLFSLRYIQPDPRIAAAEWTKRNLPAEAQILSEVYDLGILPFNDVFAVTQIELFNFYDLDGSFGKCGQQTVSEAAAQRKILELSEILVKTDYIIIPSRRIWTTRLRLPECFPNGARFYQTLFDESLGFSKIYETDELRVMNYESWGIYPEETYNVFDSPTVMIFEKEMPLGAFEYEDLLIEK